MFNKSISKETHLALLHERHAGELFRLIDSNRSHLKEWLPWVDYVKTEQDSRSFIQDSLRKFANNNGMEVGIWYQDQLAGVIGFHFFNWNNSLTSIGYWLGCSFEGKGLMIQTTAALLNYAHSELGINRVEIRCATDNRKSQAIPERLGFVKEGVARQYENLYGRFVDHIVYSHLKSDR